MPSTPTSNQSAPAIVVMAYNRPSSLERLLRSLDRASVPESVDLVISVDGGGSQHHAVTELAEGFVWSGGNKEVLQHEHLGLVDHFHRCGDLTGRFGSVVLLEDDLVVGPNFFQWATVGLAAAAADARLAGGCLSAPWFDGYRQLPFEPLLDGSAAFYLQVPWFHGMAWTSAMWQGYRQWQPPTPPVPIHAAFDQLDSDEWFPDAVRYLAANQRFYVMPREAHASNTGAAGQHFDRDSDFFQVPIQLGTTPIGQIVSLDDSFAVYDDHLELLPSVLGQLCPELVDVVPDPVADLTVDLLAVRDPSTIKTPWVLTTRPVTAAERRWGLAMRPPVMNLIEGTPGRDIALARSGDLVAGSSADAATDRKLRSYAAHGRTVGVRAGVQSTLGRFAGAWFDARTS